MNLVLFDLDHTLLNGDSQCEWGTFLVDQGIIEPSGFWQQHEQFRQDYENGILDIEAVLQFHLGILNRFPLEQLHAWREEYLQERIRPLILQKGFEVVDRHRQEDSDLILITATNDFLSAPIAELLGIEHLIASQGEKDSKGYYTGQSLGTPSYREGKVTRLTEWVKNQDRSFDDYNSTWFYSDSHNDLPLLSKVDHPIAVNPDAQLLAHGRENNWPIMDFGVEKN